MMNTSFSRAVRSHRPQCILHIRRLFCDIRFHISPRSTERTGFWNLSQSKECVTDSSCQAPPKPMMFKKGGTQTQLSRCCAGQSGGRETETLGYFVEIHNNTYKFGMGPLLNEVELGLHGLLKTILVGLRFSEKQIACLSSIHSRRQSLSHGTKQFFLFGSRLHTAFEWNHEEWWSVNGVLSQGLLHKILVGRSFSTKQPAPVQDAHNR